MQGIYVDQKIHFNFCYKKYFLLGTFGDITYVLLVGVAGSVPHYTDFYKHVRLGDVVCSVPNTNGNMFIFCDKVSIKNHFGIKMSLQKNWVNTWL